MRRRRRTLLAALAVTAGIAAATLVSPGESVGDDEEPRQLSPEEIARIDSFVARFEQGQRLMGKGRDADAERVFRDLLAERPDEAAVHHALGVVLQFRRRGDEAAAELVRAAQLAPEDAVIQRDAGLHLFAVGRGVDAERLLAIASRLAPSDVETAVGHGAALRALGRGADAEAAYRRAAKSDPNSVDAAVGLAACIVDRAPEQALALLEKSPAEWCDVAMVRGLALERLGRFDEAAQRFERAAASAPVGPEGIVFLRDAAEGLVRCGDAERALVAAQRWCAAERAAGAAKQPGGPDGPVAAPLAGVRARFCLALATAALGRNDAALDALGAPDTLADAPPAVRAHVGLFRAVTLLHAGRSDDARAALEALAAPDEASFERDAARRLLGRADAAALAARATEPGRGNDVAWIESLTAAAAGDAPAAESHRAAAAESSHPPGEYPGLLVHRRPPTDGR